MSTAPEISVVVPTYQRPDRLARLLEALTAQRDVALEVILVDDGGTVPLEPVVEPFRQRLPLRLLVQANAGPAAARNRGAREARTDVLAFTDDDCAPRHDWAALMLRAVRSASGPALAGGVTVNAIREDIFAEASQDIADFLQSRSGPHGPFAASNNIAMPKAAFEALGGFDASYPRAAGEDRAFCSAWVEHGWPVVRVPDAVVEHHHRLGVSGFWRQHRNYGFGACMFHRRRPATRMGLGRRLGFYLSLLMHPVRRDPSLRGASRIALVALAQLATAAGWREAYAAARSDSLSRDRARDGVAP